ncbi:MAG: hypothetical protein PUI84_04640 [Bacteroidales bacterium]|nr:hypothetical protein [Porphyromonas sp.]MDD6934594.1 hypothetical protein [Bacteroidales bacterium]MDY3101862.1 hypothetical protein [Porphyromonas sp.]
MRKSITLTVFLSLISLLGSVALWAQEPLSVPERRELAMRRDLFVCKELELSSEECAKLTAVLHQMDEERMAIWSDFCHLHLQVKKNPQTSRSEMTRYLKLKSECKIKDAKLVEEYSQKLSSILPPDKLIELDKVQRRFGREIARERCTK